MPPSILLAHPPNAAAHARAVAAQLTALGYEVEAHRGRGPHPRGRKVVLLWSRQAWGTPALRAVARQAHAMGSLICVRLDAAPPPVEGAPSTRLTKHVAWRRLLSAKPRTNASAPSVARRGMHQTTRAKRPMRQVETVGTDMRLHSESSSRAFAIALTFCLVSAVALGLAYTRYPQVAGPIDTAAAAVYAQVSEIAALAP